MHQQPKKSDTQPELPVVRSPLGGLTRFPVPWGLFIALGVYALLVLGYVWATYWRSPEYQSAEHVQRGLAMLGGDEGMGLERPQMEAAYSELLEAARLTPREKAIHDKLQRLRWRMDERKMRLSPELVLRSEAVASTWQRIQQEEEPILVVGLRDRKWTPREVLAGPKTAVLWSIPGGVIIILFWGYLRTTAKKVRDREQEGEVKSKERELEDLARQRTWGSVDDAGRPRASSVDVLADPTAPKRKKKVAAQAPAAVPRAAEPDEEDTAADPGPAKKAAPAARPVAPPRTASAPEVIIGLPKRRPPRE